MATLSHFPSFFFSLSPHKLSTFHSPPAALNVIHRHHQQFHRHPPRIHFAICCSSIRKPSASRKVMSDVDLCNELKEFISSVGFEEGHVPSMKDLSQHGRKDLAHIVRRRGYKLISELLANSRESGIDESDIERDLVDKRDATADWENETTGQGEKVDNLDEDVSLSTEAPILDSIGSCKKMDPIMKEDDGYGFLNESSAEVFKGNVKLTKAVVTESKILDEEHPENLSSGSNDSASLNGNIVTSEQIAPPATENYPLRDGFLSTERPISANSDKDFEVETSERENQAEINHLKLMLHQKELELSRLKEQIEKEKIALSALQIKAESEISKARKLVSEKDEELNAAEESLSGLKEVQIQYQADGEIVEVAGSFNGWHHRVQLDPQPSSSIVDPIGSRKSRLWSTVLWLYPGEYEIKFVVDGQWMIDPHRESITRGTIHNNILQVNR